MKKTRIIGQLFVDFEAEGPSHDTAMDAMDRLWAKIHWAGTIIAKEPDHPGRARVVKISAQEHFQEFEIGPPEDVFMPILKKGEPE
jgi:hypothetical protein